MVKNFTVFVRETDRAQNLKKNAYEHEKIRELKQRITKHDWKHHFDTQLKQKFNAEIGITKNLKFSYLF